MLLVLRTDSLLLRRPKRQRGCIDRSDLELDRQLGQARSNFTLLCRLANPRAQAPVRARCSVTTK